MKNLLVMSSSYDYSDDINECKSFTPVLSNFLHKYLAKNSYKSEVLCMLDSFRHKRFSVSNYETFKKIVIDTDVLKEYDNILIVGINPLKKCDPRIIEYLKSNVKGKILAIDETTRRPPGLPFICAFMIRDDESDLCKFIGQGVDLDYLYPDQNGSKLVIHIDHAYPSAVEYFDKIKKVLQKLLEYKFYENYGYESVKIIFHDEKINSLEQLHNNQENNIISFPKLAKIYRSSHIAFVSHMESMGTYPLEMSACGAVVIIPDTLAVKKQVLDQISYVDLDEQFDWNDLLRGLENIKEKNREKSKYFSFDTVIQRIDKILGYI